MFLYRKIISQAVLISWRYKYLWFFGLFAALVGSGGYEIIGQSFSSSPLLIEWGAALASTGFFGAGAFVNLRELAISQPISLVFIIFLYLLLLGSVLLILWLATVSQIAIIHSTLMIEGQKKHSFKLSLGEGSRHFWPAFLLNILEKLFIASILFIINVPIIFNIFFAPNFFNGLVYVVAFTVAVPLLLVASLIIKYAIAFIVIKNDNLAIAVKRGWHLFRQNWLVSIEMSFALFMISFLFTFGTIIILSLMVLPMFFSLNLILLAFGAPTALFVGILMASMSLILLAVIGSFSSVLQIVSWTELFIELTSKGGSSKIERLFGGVIKKKV